MKTIFLNNNVIYKFIMDCALIGTYQQDLAIKNTFKIEGQVQLILKNIKFELTKISGTHANPRQFAMCYVKKNISSNCVYGRDFCKSEFYIFAILIVPIIKF